MWIEKVVSTKKGVRYKYSERFYDKESGKNVKVSKTVAKKPTKQVEKQMTIILRDLFYEKTTAEKEKKAKLIASLTFEQVGTQWIDTVSEQVKPSTKYYYQNYLRVMLRILPDGLMFKDLTPVMMERAINNMHHKQKYSQGYTQQILSAFKAVMEHAKSAGYIDNIADFKVITLKRRKMTQQELERKNNKFLDRDELKECLALIGKKNERLGLMMEFLSRTGLRCGEMVALRRQDINGSALDVHHTLIESLPDGDPDKLSTPKNDSSYRTIDLDNRSKAILQWFITDDKRMERWGLKKNQLCPMYKDRGFIFTTRTGQPYSVRYIDNELRGMTINGKKITPHIFRHTHISMLMASHVPIKAISQRVGHSNASTTLRVYTHVTEEMRDELKTVLNSTAI